jgi:hypothetical protein
MSSITTRLVIAAILLMLGNCKGEPAEIVSPPADAGERTAAVDPPTTDPGPAGGDPAPEPDPPRPVPAADLLVSRAEPIQFNLGQVPTYTTEPARIRLINDTDDPIVLRDCKSNCGCLAASCPRGETIAPWKTAEIDIRMKSGDTPGGLVKHMDFVFADRPPSRVIFSLQAVTHVEALPAGLRPEPAPTTVALRSIDGRPFRLTSVEPPVTAGLPEGAAAEQRVEIDWRRWRREGRAPQIRVHLDHPTCPTVLLTVRTPPPE